MRCFYLRTEKIFSTKSAPANLLPSRFLACTVGIVLTKQMREDSAMVLSTKPFRHFGVLILAVEITPGKHPSVLRNTYLCKSNIWKGSLTSSRAVNISCAKLKCASEVNWRDLYFLQKSSSTTSSFTVSCPSFHLYFQEWSVPAKGKGFRSENVLEVERHYPCVYGKVSFVLSTSLPQICTWSWELFHLSDFPSPCL